MLPGLRRGLFSPQHSRASLVYSGGAPYTNQVISSFSTSQGISTPSSDRIVVCLISSYDGGGSSRPTAVTIGGITATLVYVSTGTCTAMVAYARVPTGTTATINVTFVGNTETVLMDVFAIYGCVGLYDSSSASKTSGSSTTYAATTGLNAPSDSVIFSVIETGNDGSISWSSEVTRYSNQEVNTSFDERYSTAAKLQTATVVNRFPTATNAAAFARAAIQNAVFY